MPTTDNANTAKTAPPPPGGPPAPATLSPTKRFVGLATIVVVAVVCGSLGVMVHRPSSAPPPIAVPSSVLSALMVIAGLVVMGLGVGAWAITVGTNAFTFRFDKPFMTTIGPKLWVCNVIIRTLVLIGFAIACAPLAVRLLAPLLPPAALLPVAFMGPFFVAQLLALVVTPFAPIERRLIARRLMALGCPPDLYPGGIPVGTSDPTKSSFRRFTIVERDMGLLWLHPGRLIYRGDREAFDLTPEQLLTIERKADAGSTSSYFGAVHVILHVAEPNGSVRKIRLHPKGNWTMPAGARALNELAERLWSWKASAVTTPR
jgi:hypothetical protein